MCDWSQMFVDGMSARIVEGYQFPMGDVYYGEIVRDGKVAFKTQPKKSRNECRLEMIRLLDSEIATKDAEVRRMIDLRKKMEYGNE